MLEASFVTITTATLLFLPNSHALTSRPTAGRLLLLSLHFPRLSPLLVFPIFLPRPNSLLDAFYLYAGKGGGLY